MHYTVEPCKWRRRVFEIANMPAAVAATATAACVHRLMCTFRRESDLAQVRLFFRSSHHNLVSIVCGTIPLRVPLSLASSARPYLPIRFAFFFFLFSLISFCNRCINFSDVQPVLSALAIFGHGIDCSVLMDMPYGQCREEENKLASRWYIRLILCKHITHHNNHKDTFRVLNGRIRAVAFCLTHLHFYLIWSLVECCFAESAANRRYKLHLP